MAVIGIGGPVVGIMFSPWDSNADSADNAPSKDSSAASSMPTDHPKQEYATTRADADKLVIPAMGVRTHLVKLGSSFDKTMELPPQQGAGWFTGSVSPGQPGVTIVTGFIKGKSQKPGVFARLGDLAKGDKIKVTRTDGDAAVFKVTDIKAYASGNFPTERVYASSKTPLIRLVTTGGSLKPGNPAGNMVVYGRLASFK